jgi:hypothetical protein
MKTKMALVAVAAATASALIAPVLTTATASTTTRTTRTTSTTNTTHKKVRKLTKTVALELALFNSTQRLCKYEDGSGSKLPCRWDAKKEGNGRGQSYVVVYAGKTKKGATKVYYVYADHDEYGTI